MKVPVTWLEEYCDPGWEPEKLAERLAMTGTEVERVADLGAPSADGFVVGLVKEVEPHPDADRLRVCTVDAGDGDQTIVCGAPNVAAGQLVPVALPGAVMPGGMKLKVARLRGVESNGMILSETELEMGEDSGGIAVLPEGTAEPGTPLSEVVPVDEKVLELEVTSNRSDCQAVYGVAREVHAISGADLADPPWAEDADAAGEGEASDFASVRIDDGDLCPRFTARVFTDVTIGPSPLWLKARLTAGGQRPINNVVDITNYVMLLTGQPTHAYDLDKVPGGELTVRRATDGEKMVTLDDNERTLDPDVLLVADREQPTGIAGVMGGQISEVSDQTTRVLYEAATWNGVNILRTSRKLGLRSEASARFEKQLHPALTMRAQHVASRLMIELCGAKLVPGTIDEGEGEPEPRVVTLRQPRVEQLVGLGVDVETCVERLERLGFVTEVDGEEIRATVPPERYEDVKREADLVEEVARLADLDTELPSTLPSVPERIGRLSREQMLRRRAEDALRGLGAEEIVGWSLTDLGIADRLRIPEGDPARDLIELSNPLSAEQSVLRPLLLGSLLDAARLNLSRGAPRVALFESGHAYLRERAGEGAGEGPLAGEFAGNIAAPAYEPHRIGYVAAGAAAAAWRDPDPAPDFFTAKGVLESFAGQLGIELAYSASERPWLHPGRTAEVSVGGDAGAGSPVGWIGELHPLVGREWDIEAGVAFELDLAPLIAASEWGGETYRDVTTFPPLHQDVAVVVPDDVPAAAVREAVISGGGELLHSAEAFDLYTGDQVGEGMKSLALHLAFWSPDRTLTEEEVSGRREQIRAAVSEIGGSLRE